MIHDQIEEIYNLVNHLLRAPGGRMQQKKRMDTNPRIERQLACIVFLVRVLLCELLFGVLKTTNLKSDVIKVHIDKCYILAHDFPYPCTKTAIKCDLFLVIKQQINQINHSKQLFNLIKLVLFFYLNVHFVRWLSMHIDGCLSK